MNDIQTFLPRILPIAATLGAVALLALVMFNTFDAYRATQLTAQETGSFLRGRTAPQMSASTVNLNQIASWHLFGDGSKRAQKLVQKEVIEAPTTALALTLQGTLLGNSPTEESWAIISASDNTQKMYRVGDEIPGGATLFAVEAFRVILERNGRHESLALPRPSIDDDQQASVAGKAQLPARGNRPYVAPNRIPPPPITPQVNRHTEKQALIEEMARIRKQFGR